MHTLTLTTTHPDDYLLVNLADSTVWQARRDNTWASLGTLPPGVTAALKSGRDERIMTGGR